jgi:hypothetical protein
MMAGGIAGVVMVALFGAFSTGFSTIRVNQESVRADQILVEKLETFRLYPWSSITNSAFISPTNFTTSFYAGNGVTYNGTIRISPAVTSPPLNNLYSNSIRQVTVTLNWTSAGVPRTRSMSTLVTPNGIQSLGQ